MADLKQIVQLQMAEIDQLRAENQRLVAWIMGDAPDALTTLQKVYSDPKTSVPDVIRSCNAALPFEKAKPAQTVNNIHTLFDTLERAHQRDRELRQANAKVIEHAPATGTVLGEGQGQHGAWRDQDHDDPAA
jgi:hypothetical protein